MTRFRGSVVNGRPIPYRSGAGKDAEEAGLGELRIEWVGYRL
jgi:hypothetical protein